MNSSPDTASAKMRSITELSDGRTNGVNMPLRASASQATTRASTEKIRAKPHSRRYASGGTGASSAAGRAHCSCSRHCSIRFISIW